ncbi:hypothetical protein [Angelakisella massiliensis]|uniref:hypothetical protein n=1 Tax=Angelakisella massiliensis TaxID=1871018 RepID=UPI0008F96F4F|nr:hypothetical protein [Angelakisella massiliensis]
MTTGQMLFYSGVGLMILTVITAIVFTATKPRYVPEKAEGDASSAEKKKTAPAKGTEVLKGATAQLTGGDTQLLGGDIIQQLDAEATELLGVDVNEQLGNDATQLLEEERTQLL